MKFKIDKSRGTTRELIITDYMGDRLIISNPGRSNVYIGVNDDACIHLTRRRAIALAKAIIEELT